MYVRELRVHYRKRRLVGRSLSVDRLVTPAEAARAFISLLKEEPIEVCGVFCLAARAQVLAYHELSRGTIDAALVHPREIFKVALLANATTVIVGHNHPSGDPTPSPEDLQLTERIARAGGLIGIELLDHIVIAGDQYVSFKDGGWL